jgi:signal transduction histidine kinase
VAGGPVAQGSLARLAAGPLVLIVALAALAIAHGPGRFTTYAGASGLAAALTVAAGFTLVLAGLVTSFSRPAKQVGDLAVLAGFVWFAPLLVGWEGGPVLLRSLGMVVAGFTFPLLLHLVLTYPRGRLGSGGVRALVCAAYVEAALVGAGLALFRDPFFDPGCWADCTERNVLLARSLPRVARRIEMTDRWFTVAVATVAMTILVSRLVTGSEPARRSLWPITVPGLVLGATVAAHAIEVGRSPPEDPSSTAFLSLFVIESFSIILLAAGLLWAAVRLRVQRRAVARIATNLDEAPPPGSVESALALAVGDPALRIAYWLPGSEWYVDANGHRVPEPVGAPGHPTTPLVRDGQTMAVISHAAALPELERELGAAVQLALENQRLQAEVLAQVGELRASRARIVEIGDAERRLLERDLHDGAQQRLLAVSYDIRLARSTAEAEDDEHAAVLLAEAIDEVQTVLDDLRDLAHGIYPAILTGAGIGPALASMAATAPLPVEISTLADGRYPARVEAAAYVLVADALADAAARGASQAVISLVPDDGRLLLVTVSDDGSARTSAMEHAADRVGAVGGLLEVTPTTIRAELPCG